MDDERRGHDSAPPDPFDEHVTGALDAVSESGEPDVAREWDEAVEEAVTGTVDDVTKLLTGDVPTLVDEVPVVGPVVGGTLGGVVGGAGDTLDQTTDSLLD